MWHFGNVFILLKDSFERKSTTSDVQLGSWANSVLDLKNSQADPLIPNILESMPQDNVDAVNERQRHVGRQDAIFSLYPPQPEVCVFMKHLLLRLCSQSAGILKQCFTMLWTGIVRASWCSRHWCSSSCCCLEGTLIVMIPMVWRVMGSTPAIWLS